MKEWLGTYEVVPDASRKIIMPLKFREVLPNDLLMAGLPEGFLIVCDPEFRKEALIEAPGATFEILALDSQGRLTIPSVFLGHANLDDGQSGWAMWFPNRVEIWEKTRWDLYLENIEMDKRLTHLRQEFVGDPFLRN